MSWDPNYNKDREFGDKFLPEVKQIFGHILLTEDYQIEDMERNTDLIALRMASKRIGVRARRLEYETRYDPQLYCTYRQEFTIRYSKRSGSITEFQKVMNGWGDYFIYLFGDGETRHIDHFVIIYYNRFRELVLKLWDTEGKKEFFKKRLHPVPNGDEFLTFRIDEMPEGGVVADSDYGWEMSMGWNKKIKEEPLYDIR